MKEFFKTGVLLLMMVSVSLMMSCSDDEELFATSSIVTATGSDFDGDVTGDGGNHQKSYTWNNTLQTVDYNMDITASKGGSFTLRIADADGNIVLDEQLVKGQGDDSRSGVSGSGTAGEWTVTIILDNFNGDGSWSISPGN